MSDSTTQLDLLTTNAQQEPNANALFNAASPATLFGRRESTTSGLVWGYYGGKAAISGVLTSLANGTLTLTANTTNYIEVNSAGTVSSNTAGFAAGRRRLYSVVTGATTISSYTDFRHWGATLNPLASISLSSDANRTLTQAEASADILDIASGVSLTVTRDIILPLAVKQWTVANRTTGAQSIRFIGATGTGITVGNGMRAIVYADGTNIVRVSADV